MAFKQYKDASVKENLTGEEKIHITDIDGTLKQVPINKIGPEVETDISDNPNKVPTSAAVKAFVENKMDNVQMPIEVDNAVETHGIGWTETKEVSYIWGGDTENRDVIEGQFDSIHYYKIAELDDLGACDAFISFADGNTKTLEAGIRPNTIIYASGDTYATVIKALSAGQVCVGYSPFGDIFYSDAPSSGIYFFYDDEINPRVASMDCVAEVVHKIDSKYLENLPFMVHFTLGEHGLEWDKWPDELLDITDRPIEGVLTIDDGGVYNVQYDPQLKKFYLKTLEITDNGTPIEKVTAYIEAVAWEYGSDRWRFVEVAPASGGGMVVHFEIDENQNITSDKTVAEVEEALKTMPVSGYLEAPSFRAVHALTIGYRVNGEELQLLFGRMHVLQDSVMLVPIIVANNNEWSMYTP